MVKKVMMMYYSRTKINVSGDLYFYNYNKSSPVSVTFEMEPQLEDVIVKLTSETPLVRVLPFPVDDLKSYIFVRRTSMKPKYCKFPVIWTLCLKEETKGHS